MNIAEHLQLSVLSAPLAAADRRSLSQAWYSALYAAAAAPPITGPTHAPHTPHGQRRAAGGDPKAPSPHRAALTTNAASAVPSGAIRIGGVERRASHSSLARKIADSFAAPKGLHSKHASLTVRDGDARVQIMLRPAGAGFSLIAVCAAPNRERVAKALDQARYALAARGIALHATLSAAAPC